jgi:FlaA1/EpsC-like NDP-sugar epimerase
MTYTGLRPGEKIREALWSSEEQPFLTEKPGYFEIREPAPDSLSLHSDLMRLAEAVQNRDLPRAIEIVLKLVPNYRPGTALMAIMQNALQREIRP